MKRRTLIQMTDTMRTVTAPANLLPALPTKVRVAPRIVGVGVVLAGAAALALVFARPQPAVAKGWAAAQDATRRAPYRHSVSAFDGDYRTERWDGGGRYVVVTTRRGKVLSETRSDGRREYDFFDFLSLREPRNVSPNARAVGVVRPPRRGVGTASPLSIEDRMDDVIRRGEARPSKTSFPGEGTWYDVTLRLGGAHRLDYLVRVGPDGRIAESRWSQLASQSVVYDYPESIPDAFFRPEPQARQVPVLDRDATRREIEARLRVGHGTRRGIDLRAVLLDRNGKLFAFWTGPVIGQETRGDVRLPGMPTDRPAGLWAEFAQYGSPAKRGIAPAVGRPLPGRTLVPRRKIGIRVTIAIPGVGGEAVFRDVPVLRVYDLRYERDLFGYGSPLHRR